MRISNNIPARSTCLLVIMNVVIVFGTIIGAGIVTAQSVPSQSDGQYAVVQGDECVTIDPLGNGSQSAEAFYDYRTPNTEPRSYNYSSYGTTHLQEDDTSSLFLYEGRDGISLVLLHDQHAGDTAGGAVTMEFTGLPDAGEWVIEDDSYEGRDDEFMHDRTSSRITWVYTDGRNDGAVFRGGLDDDVELTIDPAFNDAADFRLYEGTITDWQVLSATENGYERTSLDMTEPIEMRSDGCPSVSVTELEIDDTVTTGESVAITATVENAGQRTVTTAVPITVDGEIVDKRDVTLEPGETTTLSTTTTFDDAGTHTVAAGDRPMTMSVNGSGDEMVGFGVVAVSLAVLAGVLLVRYRQ